MQRAAKPTDQCGDLSKSLIEELGQGDVIQLVPRGDRPLRTVLEDVDDWYVHNSVVLPDGRVLDPTRGTEYANVRARRESVVGFDDTATVMKNGGVFTP